MGEIKPTPIQEECTSFARIDLFLSFHMVKGGPRLKTIMFDQQIKSSENNTRKMALMPNLTSMNKMLQTNLVGIPNFCRGTTSHGE